MLCVLCGSKYNTVMKKEYIYLQTCESTVVYTFQEYGMYMQYYVKYFEISLALL